MWDEYRNETDQTITVVGVLILSAKLCVADGHFSIREEEEILKIIPHEPRQKSLLLKILEKASKDPHPIEYHALQLKRFLGIRHPDFLEYGNELYLINNKVATLKSYKNFFILFSILFQILGLTFLLLLFRTILRKIKQ